MSNSLVSMQDAVLQSGLLEETARSLSHSLGFCGETRNCCAGFNPLLAKGSFLNHSLAITYNKSLRNTVVLSFLRVARFRQSLSLCETGGIQAQ